MENEEDKKHRLQLYIPHDIYEELRRLSYIKHISMNKLIIGTLNKCLLEKEEAGEKT